MNRITTTLALVLTLAGCSEEAEPPEANAAPGTETAEAEPEAPAAPETFEYTEELSADVIPNSPVTAMANGRPIEIKTVLFQPRFNEWGMTLSTAELDRPTAILAGMKEAVNLSDLPQEMGVGTYTHGIDESGGGYFQIQKIDEPERTTSWNTNTAYHLEITEWTAGDYDPEGSMFQEAGRASGKVVAVFRGREGSFANSWVAGTFENAVVRYMGRPRWMEEEEAE